MIETIRSIRPLDIVDILIVSYLIYRTLLLIRGTRAVQMVLGITSILLLYFVSAYFELQTLRVLLKTFLGSLLVVIVILFQAEIRRGLARMGKPRFFHTKQSSDNDLEEIVRAASLLARRHLGALIVLERDNGLRDFLEGGFRLDARIQAELLLAIFQTSSPMHDGGVIIHKQRIHSSGCLLPLSQNPNIDKRYGTRHRAALGLSEETDAIVIVVSEETQTISLARNGRLTPFKDEAQLLSTLKAIFFPGKKASRRPRSPRSGVKDAA
ncbi:MAG: TIGR00159 family protein [Desulfobulbaceae bacterium]|nr:TIGR00159 family protein [Desulfobulbaceae bacterium]